MNITEAKECLGTRQGSNLQLLKKYLESLIRLDMASETDRKELLAVNTILNNRRQD